MNRALCVAMAKANLCFVSVIIAAALSACGDLTLDDLVPCDLEMVVQCPNATTCVRGECRPECNSDAECDTCCRDTNDGPRACAPIEVCNDQKYR
jgi:hypothetical protein